MDFFLLAASFVSFVTFAKVTHHFLREIISSSLKKRDLPLIFIAVAQVVFAVVLLLWGLGQFSFILGDYIIIFSSVMLLQTAALLSIMYNASKNAKTLYPLLLYILLVPLLYLDTASIHMIIPVSFLVILLSFTLFSNLHKKINQTPILYAAFSLIGYIFSTIWQNLIPVVNVLSGLLFLLFIHFFMKRLRVRPEMTILQRGAHNSPIIEFSKHFVFLILLTNFVFIGTIGVHELGHVGAAKFFDCKDAKIVLDIQGMPHTQTTCSNTAPVKKLIWLGILLPFILAGLLLFSAGKFIKEIALQIIACNLLISYQDFLQLGITIPVAVAISILGAALGVLSLGLLAKSRAF